MTHPLTSLLRTRILRALAILCLAIGLVEMLVAAGFLARTWVWRAGTTATTGTVTAHRVPERRAAARGARLPSAAEVVRFTDAGGASREFESWISSSSPFAVGETVAVRYRTDDPADAAIDSWFRMWGFPSIFVVAGAVFVSFGLAVRGIAARVGGAGA